MSGWGSSSNFDLPLGTHVHYINGVTQDKGQEAELAALARMIREGMPAAFIAEQLAVSRATLEAEYRLMKKDPLESP